MQTVKIALIGCGLIARTHARILKKNVTGADLFSCDRNQNKAENYAAQFSSTSATCTASGIS